MQVRCHYTTIVTDEYSISYVAASYLGAYPFMWIACPEFRIILFNLELAFQGIKL